MSNYKFDIYTRTQLINDFPLTKTKKEIAKRHNVQRVFIFDCIRGDVRFLPAHIKAAINNAGYRPVIIGGAANSYSVIGLTPDNRNI